MKDSKEMFTKIISLEKIDKQDKEEKIQFEKRFFKSSTLKLSKIYSITSERQKYLLVIIMGMLIGLFTLFFLKNTGLYSMGISAFTQGLSRLITALMTSNNVDALMVNVISEFTFWFLLFFVNIPLLFFSRKYIGNKFTYLTLVYLITASLFPFILSITLKEKITDIFLFGNVESIYFSTLKNKNLIVLTWDNLDVHKVISLFFYAIIYPFLVVWFYTIIYAVGGSTGGSDIISIYYLKRKLKSLGEILIVVNFISVILGSFLGSFLSIGILQNDWGYQNFFSPNLICSILTFSIFGFLLQILYPRFRIVSIKVIGKNIEKINDHLNEIKCVHSRTISKAIGSYSKKEQLILEMYLTIIELGPIISEIRKADDKAFIIINKEIEIDGNLNYPIFLR